MIKTTVAMECPKLSFLPRSHVLLLLVLCCLSLMAPGLAQIPGGGLRGCPPGWTSSSLPSECHVVKRGGPPAVPQFSHTSRDWNLRWNPHIHTDSLGQCGPGLPGLFTSLALPSVAHESKLRKFIQQPLGGSPCPPLQPGSWRPHTNLAALQALVLPRTLWSLLPLPVTFSCAEIFPVSTLSLDPTGFSFLIVVPFLSLSPISTHSSTPP